LSVYHHHFLSLSRPLPRLNPYMNRKPLSHGNHRAAVNFYEKALFREPDSDQRRSSRLRTAEITHRVEPSCLLLVAGRPALGGETHNRAVIVPPGKAEINNNPSLAMLSPPVRDYPIGFHLRGLVCYCVLKIASTILAKSPQLATGVVWSANCESCHDLSARKSIQPIAQFGKF
jgi:hypothetical protein